MCTCVYCTSCMRMISPSFLTYTLACALTFTPSTPPGLSPPRPRVGWSQATRITYCLDKFPFLQKFFPEASGQLKLSEAISVDLEAGDGCEGGDRTARGCLRLNLSEAWHRRILTMLLEKWYATLGLRLDVTINGINWKCAVLEIGQNMVVRL